MATQNPAQGSPKPAGAPRSAPTWAGFLEFLKGVREELKSPRTVWPTRAELIQLTQVVLALIAAVAIYCGGLDYLLGLITSKLIHR
jgi:preprotein translocase SecE subunit